MPYWKTFYAHRKYLIVQREGVNSFEICHTQWIWANNKKRALKKYLEEVLALDEEGATIATQKDFAHAVKYSAANLKMTERLCKKSRKYQETKGNIWRERVLAEIDALRKKPEPELFPKK